MGNILHKFFCDDSCAKYVCNAMHIESECSDCCRLEVDTKKVDVSESPDLEIGKTSSDDYYFVFNK